jgi:hypothetical protein
MNSLTFCEEIFLAVNNQLQKSMKNLAYLVAAQSEAPDFSYRTLGSGFEHRLGHGCLLFVSTGFVVLCRYRPCDGQIPRPGNPTVCRTIIKKSLLWPYASDGNDSKHAHICVHTTE